MYSSALMCSISRVTISMLLLWKVFPRASCNSSKLKQFGLATLPSNNETIGSNQHYWNSSRRIHETPVYHRSSKVQQYSSSFTDSDSTSSSFINAPSYSRRPISSDSFVLPEHNAVVGYHQHTGKSGFPTDNSMKPLQNSNIKRVDSVLQPPPIATNTNAMPVTGTHMHSASPAGSHFGDAYTSNGYSNAATHPASSYAAVAVANHYQPYSSQHHPHHPKEEEEEEEELPEIEDKVFSKTVAGVKALKVGKLIFTFFMVIVVFILAGLAKVGVSLSPAILPIALLPIGVIALLLFVPLFLLFLPLAATGLAGGEKKRRKRNVISNFETEIDKHLDDFEMNMLRIIGSISNQQYSPI